MGGNLKSPAITRNKIFRVKNVAFLPNHKDSGSKCTLNQIFDIQ